MRLTLREIAEACGGKLVIQGNGNNYDEGVSSVVIDSRKVEKGSVFIATEGERVDGHRFICQAFSQGALLAVTQKTPDQVSEESGIDCSAWGCFCLVKDSFQALKDIAEYYRKKMNIPIVGITGSVGKTSTKEFVAGVLSEKYRVLKTEGNFNNEVGVPLTLLRIREEHQAAVVEMGISDFGEMHRLSRMVRPDICVITNIGQSHLENLKTRNGILKAKSEIFDFMAEDGEICLNGGDDKLRGMKKIKGHRPHFFGLGENPNEETVAAEIRSRGLWGSDAVLEMTEASGEQLRMPVHIPLPGRHMVLNAAAAACVAGLMGLSPEQIAAGIEKIQPVSGRNNLLRLEKYTVIDDCYNANPASMKAAIDLLAMADTETVAILGDMFELGEKSPELHREVGAYAAEKGIDRILFEGDMARYMFLAAVKQTKNPEYIKHFPSKEAMRECLREKREDWIPDGCTVLVKASHGMGYGAVLEDIREMGGETVS